MILVWALKCGTSDKRVETSGKWVETTRKWLKTTGKGEETNRVESAGK